MTGRRVLVTGAAGFIGSHLCDALVARGDTVVGVDDLSTGNEANVCQVEGHERFRLVVADVADRAFEGWLASRYATARFDQVFHLASPASVHLYLSRPVATLDAGGAATRALLEAATVWGARLVVASSSEIYGEPQVHPQDEDAWGRVSTVGPRSAYDEAKRYAEALAAGWRRQRGTDVAVARIFNCYGERLAAADGRVVPNFVRQALAGEALTVYGDGSQTRCFCHVSDMVDGLVALADSSVSEPVNLGSDSEVTVAELAKAVIDACGSSSPVEHRALPADDPTRRRPDISRARELLGWEPRLGLGEGLSRTVAWFRSAGTIPCMDQHRADLTTGWGT